MRLPPLIPVTMLRRYKRFLADIQFADGSESTAHCANPGSMLGLIAAPQRAYVSAASTPDRKLRWSLELLDVNGTLVGINTGRANAIVEESLRTGLLAELAGTGRITRESAYGKSSRVDFCIRSQTEDLYLEVKSVTLSRQTGLAEFPDSVTSRGARHMSELAGVVAQGHRAVLVYLIQRSDCHRFALAADLDPAYARAAAAARAAGVRMLAAGCRVTPDDITIDRMIDLSG